MVSVYTATTAASSTTAISNIMVDGVDISEFEFDDDSSRSSVQSLLTQLGGAIPVPLKRLAATKTTILLVVLVLWRFLC